MRYRVGALLCFALASAALFSCGENESGTVTPGDGFYTFTLREEKGGYFISDYKGSEKALLLPDYVKEGDKKTPVVGIDGYAFSLRPVEELELGKNIKYLSDNAFAESSITELYVTPSLREVSGNAFSGSKIKADYLDGIQYLKSKECPNLIAIHTNYKRGSTKILEGCVTVLDNVFKGVSLEVTIPSSIRHIGDGNFAKDGSFIAFEGKELQLDYVYPYMFHGSSGIKSIVLDKGMEKLSANTFDGCGKLTSLYLPDGIEAIEKNAIPSEFTAYTTIEGIRYLGSKEKPSLYCFGGTPENINVKLSENTKVIADGAFASNQTIWSLRPGDNLIRIGDGAFSECRSLRKVDIPASTKYIGSDSFSSCPNLELFTKAKEGDLTCDLTWAKDKVAIHYESSFQDFDLVPITPTSLYWESDKTLAIDVTQFANDTSSRFHNEEVAGLYLSPATLSATVGKKEVKIVEITGKYGSFATENGSITISEDWDSSIVIRLNDLTYDIEVGDKSSPALLAKTDVTLEIVGDCELVSSPSGQGAIVGKKIAVQGKGVLTVKGGEPSIYNHSHADAGILCDELDIITGSVIAKGSDGGKYLGATWPVENGGNGITCKSINVRSFGSLTAIGGNGGLGRNGSPATSQTTHNEENGENGGNGGIGLYCDRFTLAPSVMKSALKGGNGGNGGAGGNGTTATGASANGTNGGNGGTGGSALSVVTYSGPDSHPDWSAGAGGSGGAAGKKGASWAGMQFGSDGTKGKDGASGTLIVTREA